MRFLITRPQPDALKLANRLKSMGHEAVVSPVINTVCCPASLPAPDRIDGLIITSRNALRCLEKTREHKAYLNLPLFAVGKATAQQATALGFSLVLQGKGRASALPPQIKAFYKAHQAPQLLHPGTAKKAFELTPALAALGIKLLEHEVYRTQLCENMTADAIARLCSGEIDGVILLSPRTAKHFHTLINQNALKEEMGAVSCLCLSQNVANALGDMPRKTTITAKHPDLDTLLGLINAP